MEINVGAGLAPALFFWATARVAPTGSMRIMGN